MSISTPISPPKQPLKQLLLPLKMLLFHSSLQKLMCSPLPTWTIYSHTRKSTKYCSLLLTIKTLPLPPPHQLLHFPVSLVKLATLNMSLSAHSSSGWSSCVHPVPASVQLQGVFQSAMCIRQSRAQGKVLSPHLWVTTANQIQRVESFTFIQVKGRRKLRSQTVVTLKKAGVY